jgi:hypothetical protein
MPTVQEVNDAVASLSSEDRNKVQDGYHSFSELYKHRITLYITLCRVLSIHSGPSNPIWCSKKQSDGNEIKGWFLLGINKTSNYQITYHLPNSEWEEVSKFAEVLNTAPVWDGHTSNDVLMRLNWISPLY